jgi:hypothetical protein
MKKLLILIVGLCIFYTSGAQTNVSGGIYSNTTWTTAGSPYIVTDTVVVFASVKLTIQPGVVIKFDSNALMEVWGGLSAVGTAADSIIFTSNSATPFAGIYNGIMNAPSSDTISFRYCRFSYANTAYWGSTTFSTPLSHCYFLSNLLGVLSYSGDEYIDTCTFKYDSAGISPSINNGIVSGCVFKYNSVGISQAFALDLAIINCTFLNNRGAINEMNRGSIVNCIIDSNEYYGISGAESSTINYCIIKYNGKGIDLAGHDNISYNDISYNGVGINTYTDRDTIEFNTISNNISGIETLDDIIHCNTICNNSHYNIIAEMQDNELASNNYWCTSDSAQIQATIYDAYQDINLGFVFFTPLDTIACANISTSINELPTTSNEIKLYPNPNRGSFTIQLSVVGGQSSVEIYNMLGQKVITETLRASQDDNLINLKGQPSGIYLYRIISETGSLIGTGKFVVE